MQDKQDRTKIYFVSDSHLGVPDHASSLAREKLLVAWLDEISADAAEIYLLGDMFDFWFEYGTVVPKGFVRLLGKLAEIADAGIKVHYFTGNHDMWMFDYLPSEFGIPVYRKPVTREIGGKRFMIGHGDGLGPRDHGYKFIKRLFASRTCQWLFARIHPNLGVRIALYFSHKSRTATGNEDEIFHGQDKEYLMIHIRKLLQKEHFDYFIFGHRHLPVDIKIQENVRYINLGDWITYFTYGVYDGREMLLRFYVQNGGKEIITG